MKKILLVSLLSLAPALAPVLAMAEVKVGDVIGTDAETAKAALEKAGCPAEKFEAEDGMVEAVCKTAEGATLEIVIDPKTGAVTDIKTGD